MRKLVAAVVFAASAMAANARSLLYYYDFDKVENGALVYTGVNKGTGALEPTFKQSGSNPLGFVSGGALGSGYALSESSPSSLWLGDGSASLGCSTDRGFTISFWVKTSSSHNAYSDFFGFRLNGVDYRIEYIAKNNSNATFYYYPKANNSSATNPTVRLDGNGTTITELTSGAWKHVAFVAKPNGTNSVGTCLFYVDGKHIANINFFRGGNLQQLHIGSTVRRQLYDGNDRATNTGGTCLDELALFDYPATDEQVKWLAKYKPAQPVAGPGREMPYCWHFDTTNATFGATAKVNSGTGTAVAFLYGDEKENNPGVNTTGYITAPTANAALGTAYAMNAGNRATWRISDSAGLGATVGSGFTFSFWMRGNAAPSNWTDCFTFGVGGKFMRYEFNSTRPTSGLNVYGGSNTGPYTRKADTWQHYCAVWNEAEQKIDFYQDGEFKWRSTYGTTPDPAHVVTTMMAGRQSMNDDNTWRLAGKAGNINPNVFVDEVALYNYSLSPEQIAWLTNNVPCLPPLDATNLVRTVTTSGAWAGGLASWGVREWDDDGEAWTDTTRTTIYPTLEDTEVEVAVAFADGVVITNDTFVTPQKLSLTAATSAALPVSATLKCAEDSRFAPEALEIGDGLQLTVPLYDAKVGGTLTFGADAKIVFDVSNYDGGDVALVTDGIALPAGESDALAHFGVTDPRFALSLSADGKTVYARLDNVAATATWTGAGDGTSLNSAANWECRNGSGTLLTGDDALPCELTRVIVCSGSATLNAPVGTEIPWQYLRIEAGNATLAADADWCGIPSLCVPDGVTVDLNGKKLHLNGKIEGSGAFTSAAAGGELHVDVPAGMTNANASVAFKGSLKLAKDGDGTFVAACESQTYTGGTEIADGTLKLGTSNLPLGAKNASVKICAGAVYDMNGCFSTSSCIYAYDLAGTMRSQTATESYGWNNAYRILGGTFVVSGDDARLELGNVYFACPDGTSWFTMNGHTLTFDGTNYVGLGAFRSNDYGKWVFSGGSCRYEWLNGCGPTNVDVEVYAPACFKLKGNADVKGLVYEGTSWSKNQVVSHLLVLGRYVAGPCHLPIQMCNGSTLDLSVITGSFDLTNAVANTTAAVASAVVGDMTFQSGTAEAPSVVNVNLAGKTDLNAIRKSESPYVVTWPSQPANVDFVIDAQSKAEGYRIYPEAGGLRLKRFMGVMILVR